MRTLGSNTPEAASAVVKYLELLLRQASAGDRAHDQQARVHWQGDPGDPARLIACHEYRRPGDVPTGAFICHKAACVPGSQPRPGSIIARSTAHRPETRRNRAHFAARTRRNFLSFDVTLRGGSQVGSRSVRRRFAIEDLSLNIG